MFYLYLYYINTFVRSSLVILSDVFSPMTTNKIQFLKKNEDKRFGKIFEFKVSREYANFLI